MTVGHGPCFLSCDWGTSSFRLRLVECQGLKVLAQQDSAEGTAQTHRLWSAAAQAPERRTDFYRGVLRPHLERLRAAAAGSALDGVPIVMSGMASSTLGLRELPYRPMPFAVDGSDLLTERIAPAADFPHPILLISGACTADDVMRGEETQLVGCRFERTPEAQLFLHPGTHAKHVEVRDGQARSLRTYMTGELFALLSKDSILAGSIEQGGTLQDDESHLHWFEQGVRAGRDGNLLHDAFAVRTNDLFGRASRRDNRFYLSGLLIGAECRDLLAQPPARITLAGESELLAHYAAALRTLGIAGRCPVHLQSAEQVTLEGQLAVLRRH